MPILHAVQTPDPGPPRPVVRPTAPRPTPDFDRRGEWVLSAGERVAWIGGIVLALSAFMDWYAGSDGEGPALGVIGWHTGVLGKLVFFIGLAVIVLVALRDAGFELPPSIPEALVLIGLGALATTFVVIRIVSVPDDFFPWKGRGIGIWISLAAALAVIVAGLLRASEEL